MGHRASRVSMPQPFIPGDSAPDPSHEGPPAPAELLGLVRKAYVARQTGYVHITHGRERRGLAIRGGHIVHGRSDVAGEHLGDVLVRQGLVSQADLERAVEEVLAERRPLGAVLARLCLVDEERLEEAVGAHVREILFAALERIDGTATFEEKDDDPSVGPEHGPASRLSTGAILLEAARRLRDPATVHAALGDVDRKLVPGVDPRLRAHPVALTPADGFVLSRIDGTLSAREIVELMPLPPEETERSLLGLLCSGAIAVAPEGHPATRHAPPPWPAASAAAPADAPAAPPAEPAEPPSPPPGLKPPASAPPDAAPATAVQPSPAFSVQEVRRAILEGYRTLSERDHFELLGVSPQSSAAELRAAYALLARTLHPDACGDPALADLTEQRQAVFLRVCRAYETLRDPEARTAYERDFRRKKPGPPAAPLLARAPVAPPEAPVSAPPAQEAPRRAAVAPPGPEPPPPSLEERLAETIAVGEELLRDGHYWEAIQQIEPTLPQARGELRVRARIALARACQKNPRWLKRAETHLQDAVREDPDRAEAHLLLGDVYRAGSFRARALASYRKVLDLQPHNRQALRAIAAMEPEEPPPARGSLLGIFKKR
jgi:hypothetical protein